MKIKPSDKVPCFVMVNVSARSGYARHYMQSTADAAKAIGTCPDNRMTKTEIKALAATIRSAMVRNKSFSYGKYVVINQVPSELPI